jgi:hypothetical protein
MKSVPHLFLALLLASCASSAAEVRRYRYCSTPGGTRAQGKSGAGLLVFDIDKGHRFVRRIAIPVFMEGLRGLTGCTATGRLYYSTNNRPSRPQHERSRLGLLLSRWKLRLLAHAGCLRRENAQAGCVAEGRERQAIRDLHVHRGAFDGDKVARVGCEFGLGRLNAGR